MSTGEILLWWLILVLIGLDLFHFFQDRGREQRRRDELYDKWRRGRRQR
jgi:hypothetical protein